VKISTFTRTRRGRVALAAVPAAAAVTMLMAGVANGAVPVSFAVSGQAFQVGASDLEGNGFSQYSGVALDANKKQIPVAISNIDSAKLYDLCQYVAVAGPIGLKIAAGGGGTPATATGLQIGMTDLKGDATFTNINIGADASTVRYGPKGTAGDFAQDAEKVSIKGLEQTAYSTTAGTFKLHGLHMFISTNPSKDECFTPVG
jgi:hypothetical protein